VQLMGSRTGICPSIKMPGYWKNKENRRNHLCEIAAEMGFDPLVAGNWEQQENHSLKIAASPLKHLFNGNCKRAIADAFPELGFSEKWITGVTETTGKTICLFFFCLNILNRLLSGIESARKVQGHWNSREKRRDYLREWAAKMGFDPLVANNWETKTTKSLPKEARYFVRRYFEGNYKQTLADAFPELEFSREWFREHDEHAAKYKTLEQCAEKLTTSTV